MRFRPRSKSFFLNASASSCPPLGPHEPRGSSLPSVLRLSVLTRAAVVMIALALFALRAGAQVTPHAGMLRYPDVSAESIVFVYADDLWLVPRTGGLATPLASPPGGELFPR